MTIQISDRTRAIVAETLPLMEQHRDAVEKSLERCLARQGPDDSSRGRSSIAARAITDMLYGHARQLHETGAPAGIVETARRHRALALDAEHYASFGDALKPIMRDVLGEKATPRLVAAWGDVYWAVVRRLLRPEKRLAA